MRQHVHPLDQPVEPGETVASRSIGVVTRVSLHLTSLLFFKVSANHGYFSILLNHHLVKTSRHTITLLCSTTQSLSETKADQIIMKTLSSVAVIMTVLTSMSPPTSCLAISRRDACTFGHDPDCLPNMNLVKTSATVSHLHLTHLSSLRQAY